MSPAQAAQAAGVSRWTIMRAINSHKLKAHRDNRNNWQVSNEDLDQWWAHSVRQQQNAPPSAHPDVSPELREKLAGETARADAAERARDQAELDRDRWREIAEKLASRPRRLWPWGK